MTPKHLGGVPNLFDSGKDRLGGVFKICSIAEAIFWERVPNLFDSGSDRLGEEVQIRLMLAAIVLGGSKFEWFRLRLFDGSFQIQMIEIRFLGEGRFTIASVRSTWAQTRFKRFREVFP